MPERIEHIRAHNDIPGFSHATAVGHTVHPSRLNSPVFHGSGEQPDCVNSNRGLARRGCDIELHRHAEPLNGISNPDSAFRGCTPFLSCVCSGQGAPEWAGDGGFIYRIEGWPFYDVVALLEGRIPDGTGGFRGLRLTGECELAIPAPVPIDCVTGIGESIRNARGKAVCEWMHTPPKAE